MSTRFDERIKTLEQISNRLDNMIQLDMDETLEAVQPMIDLGAYADRELVDAILEVSADVVRLKARIDEKLHSLKVKRGDFKEDFPDLDFG